MAANIKALSLNSLIERTRRRRKKKPNKEYDEKEMMSDEESAIVKAAAWAWYQRSNSASEGILRTTSTSSENFEHIRSQRHPKPSRYKLEAMRLMASSSSSEDHCTDGLVSLLDAHEIRSISMRLDSFILAESISAQNKLCDDDDDDGRKKKKNKNKKKKKGRIWGIHGVMCSTREEDVADNGVIGRRRVSPLAKSSVPVVHLPKCLPRV